MAVESLSAWLFEGAASRHAQVERVVRRARSGALARGLAQSRPWATTLAVLATWGALMAHPASRVLAGTAIAVESQTAFPAHGQPPPGDRPAGSLPASRNATPLGANQEAHPVFRTGTVLVEVDVTVHDRQGRFVDDLGPADFAIYEDGVPQRVARLLLVRAHEAAGWPHPGPAGPASSTRVVSVPRVIVLVVDDWHLSPGAFLRVRRAAMEFLAGLAPEDVAGVVISGSMAGGRLTTDKRALEAALAAAAPSPRAASDAAELRDWPRLLGVEEALRIAGGDGAVLDLVVRRACDDEPSACRQGQDIVQMEVMGKSRHVAAAHQDRVRNSLRVWQAVADALRRFDGPKTVVLLTEGFAIGDEAEAVRRIVDAAWRAGATFFAVDACGAGRDGDRVPDLEPPEAAVTTLAGRAAAWHEAEDAGNAVAADTGGYLARHTNDVAGALAAIARTRSAHYLLAYSPSNPAADGTWRRLRVEVAREHVTVRARRGYVASSAPRVIIAPVAAAGGAGAGSTGEEPGDSRQAGPATNRGAGTGASGTAAIPDAHADAGDPTTRAPSRGGAAGETGTGGDKDRPVEPTPEVSPPTGEAPPRAATVPGGPGASAGAASVRLRPGSAEGVASLAGAGAPSGTTSWTPAAERDARLGWAAYERGDVEAARRHLETAVSGSAPPWVHYALGQAAFATGGMAQATAAWERVRAAAPEFEPVYFDLVDAYLRAGQSVRALGVLEEAARRWPDDPEVLNATGVIHLGRGSVEAAVRAFERAVAARPDEALGHFNLGRAYEIRFVRSARFVRSTRQWYRDEDARRLAVKHYRRHVELGGAFAHQAQEGLDRLEWVPRQPGL